MTKAEKSYSDAIVDTMSQPLVVLTGDLEVERVNNAFCHVFKVTPAASEGRKIYDLGNGQWNIPALRRLLEEVLSEKSEIRTYRVEHDFEGIGPRVMMLNARRIERERTHDRILLAIDDKTEEERAKWELEGRIEFADKLIDSVREGLLILHWDLTVHSANKSFYDMFRVEKSETEGRKVYDLGDGQWDIPELRRLLEEILPQKSTFNDYQVEHEFDVIGRRHMSLNARRLDHLDLIILAVRDVTDRKARERRQVEFMRELQHRVKNILANVRSLAKLTRQRTADLDGFFQAFWPRLAALDRVQQLLVESPEDQLEIADIVRMELEAVGAQAGRNYTATGPPVWLRPGEGQVFAMAVHELATNSGKYGALTAKGGRIEVTWEKAETENGDAISFVWRESGVKIPGPHGAPGLGSTIIEKSVPHMLGGTAELAFHPDGAECRMIFYRAPESGPP